MIYYTKVNKYIDENEFLEKKNSFTNIFVLLFYWDRIIKD